MKKQVLFALAFAAAVCSVNAQNYDSGKMGAPGFDGANLEMPTWFTGNNHVSPKAKSGIDGTVKETWAEFCAALGYTETPTAAIDIWYYGIKKQTTDPASTNENPLSYIKADIPAAGTLSIDFYATGGTGMQIRKTLTDPASIASENYGNSFTPLKVSYTATAPETVYLVPMKDAAGTLTSGDCMFSQVKFVSGTSGIASSTSDNAIVSSDFFSITGIQLSTPERGINIEKTTYADGTVKTTKLYFK